MAGSALPPPVRPRTIRRAPENRRLAETDREPPSGSFSGPDLAQVLVVIPLRWQLRPHVASTITLSIYTMPHRVRGCEYPKLRPLTPSGSKQYPPSPPQLRNAYWQGIAGHKRVAGPRKKDLLHDVAVW